jgi:hypothetical protein
MAKKDQTDESIKYGGLSNSEIMLVYYRFKKYVDNLDENLNKNQVTKTVKTPMGNATAIMQISEEHVAKFKATEYYILAKSVVAKLGPIVELLESCDDTFKQLANELR